MSRTDRQRAALRLALGGLLLAGSCLRAPSRVAAAGEQNPATVSLAPVPPPPASAEILWDSWGVPHIFAADDRGLFFAFGWAQMESHGDLLLRSYGAARGRAAEYWGEDFLDSDRWVLTHGVPARARRWYERQSPAMREDLDAFAEGLDAYAREHPDQLSREVRQVLPVDAVDVLARVHHLLHFTFLVSQEAVQQDIQDAQEGQRLGRGTPARSAGAEAGSMGWAVAPGRSASGRALLLINPHLAWDTPERWYEAQLTASGVDVYGAAVVGVPALAVVPADRLGWTQCHNLLEAYNLYRLTLAGNGYRWNGEVRPFEREQRVIKVKSADGRLRDEKLEIRRSVHGPVVYERRGVALALRVAGIDEPDGVGQYWQMARARGLGDFEAALRRLQVPTFTILYADGDGHILDLWNGRVPARARGDWDFWQGVVPGDGPDTLWTATHAYDDLPRLVDPPTGWLQNSNDPPWSATWPALLDWRKFPPYMAPPPGLGMRQQRSAKLLLDAPKLTLEGMIDAKQSTRSELADRILGDLLAVVRARGGEAARQAAAVLGAWDRQTEAGSRGAVLFEAFYHELLRPLTPGQRAVAVPWNEREPFSTPRGLRDPAAALTALETAAAAVIRGYGRLDVPWGEVHRLRRDGLDLPGNGGPAALGIVRTLEYAAAAGGKLHAMAGETFVAAVELSSPPRARALLAYGNSSRPGSRHRTDQLPLLARKELRPVWRSRAEIEAHLELRELIAEPAAAIH